MKIEVSETIALSPTQLFAILTDFESHLKHWTRGVVSVQAASKNDLGAGSAFVITGRNLGFKTKVKWDYTVTACEPPIRFAGTADGGPVPFDEEFRLEGVPEGTKITHIQNLRPEGQFKLASPLLSIAWSKLLRQNLSRLKKRAESLDKAG